MAVYTIGLYWKNKMLGKYKVDTKAKSLAVVESKPFGFLDTNFDYNRFFEFLCGRMVDKGRVDRNELLGYDEAPLSVWDEMIKTQGFDNDDFLWVNFDGIHTKTIYDFHPRLNSEAVSVYDKSNF